MSPNTIKTMQPVTVTVYAGVDVAKANLQLHLQGRQAEFPNQPAGLVQLCQQLQTIPHVHVVCEATGGYERPLSRPCTKRKSPSRSPIQRRCAQPPRPKVNEPKPTALTPPC